MDGTIESTHCDCMAGLGECCSHVAALLWALEAAVRLRETKTPTQVTAYWNTAPVKNTIYSEVASMDFTSPGLKHKQIQCDKQPEFKKLNRESAIPEPTTDELAELWKTLDESSGNPGILAIVPGYCQKFIPSILSDKFPILLPGLRKPECFTMPLHDLVKEGEGLDLSITDTEINNVEKTTQGQSFSKKWFQFRAGRITASKMKSVCHTNPENPSKSLIKQICFPEMSKFSSEGTKWGCHHEATALGNYEEYMGTQHSDFSLSKCGFWLNKDYPFIGATPDGLTYCSCCGEGCVEVKCPFCKKHKSILESVGDDFYLKESGSKGIQLDSKHTYHYQIQTQLFTTGRAHCDFVVWTTKEIYIERIYANTEFWEYIVPKAKQFFFHCILPELIGSYFTRSLPSSCSSTDNLMEGDCCYCRKPESEPMLVCHNPACLIKKFHLNCLKIKRSPSSKAKWLCISCKKLPQYKKVSGKSTK